jgi:hypothetical protein
MEQLIAKARLYALENAKSYQEVFEALGIEPEVYEEILINEIDGIIAVRVSDLKRVAEGVSIEEIRDDI